MIYDIAISWWQVSTWEYLGHNKPAKSKSQFVGGIRLLNFPRQKKIGKLVTLSPSFTSNQKENISEIKTAKCNQVPDFAETLLKTTTKPLYLRKVSKMTFGLRD